MNSSPSQNYFSSLSQVIAATQVTTESGAPCTLDEGVRHGLRLLNETRERQAKVLLLGNGGSAAIVSHLHNDLCKNLGLRALVFNEPPLLTALANDHGYSCVFERPVQIWAESGDLIIAVSSSGMSESILRPVEVGLERGCKVMTFSGFEAENSLRGRGHLNFYVPAATYGFVEIAHAALCHCLTDLASATL